MVELDGVRESLGPGLWIPELFKCTTPLDCLAKAGRDRWFGGTLHYRRAPLISRYSSRTAGLRELPLAPLPTSLACPGMLLVTRSRGDRPCQKRLWQAHPAPSGSVLDSDGVP